MVATPPPREVNDVAIVTAGLIGWVLALIITLIAGAGAKVISVCAAGVLLGLWGLRYVRRRRARLRAQASS